MIILGIDPGSINMGYGLIEKNGNKLTHVDNGVIHLEKDLISVKLEIIYNKLIEIIKEHKPEIMSIENVFFSKNVQSTVKLSHVRGVAILSAKLSAIPVYQFTPLEVKKAVVGYGGAEKNQIQEMIKIILNLKEKTFTDASDALALAVTYANLPVFQKDEHLT